MIANMRAELVLRTRLLLDEALRAEVVIWRVPRPLAGSSHFFKYRMALIEHVTCVLRYDNEVGKGDHKHLGDVEVEYVFSTLSALQDDFWADVMDYRKRGTP